MCNESMYLRHRYARTSAIDTQANDGGTERRYIIDLEDAASASRTGGSDPRIRERIDCDTGV